MWITSWAKTCRPEAHLGNGEKFGLTVVGSVK